MDRSDSAGFSVSTIGEEKRWNPRLAGKSRQEFVAAMSELRLPRLVMADEALIANGACGCNDSAVATVDVITAECRPER